VAEGQSAIPKPRGALEIEIWSNDTKATWLHQVTDQFNEQENKNLAGKPIFVNVRQLDSGDFPPEIELLRNEKSKGPTIISPGTIAWVNAADVIWKDIHGKTLIDEPCPPLAFAPIGFGMWQSMAEAMGWPDKLIGWEEILALAADPSGWARYGHPEWGQFKFGHTDPNSSNTGLAAMTSFVYATLGQTSGLTPELARSAQVVDAFETLESITFHYGSSTRSLNVSTATRGPSYLHATASSENGVLATNKFQGPLMREPMVFLFPKEGAFWSENPYCVVNAPWVTAEHKEAARIYRDYLLSAEAQAQTVDGWLRPVNVEHLPEVLPAEWHHTDVTVTIDDIPPLETDTSGETATSIQDVFNRAKKKATTFLVLDTSGSMNGEKIRLAKEGLALFLEQLDKDDELKIYLFNNDVTVLQSLARAGRVVETLYDRVDRLSSRGGTSLYQAVCQVKNAAEAAKEKDEAAGEQRLYGIVLLSDGKDTESTISRGEMFRECLPQNETADVVKVFTIAYGADADEALLESIAERSYGRAFVAHPDNIGQVYEAISFEQ
jgi:Ca-activated chloride channel family protein